MPEAQIIKCTFCRGTGSNPHFRGTCPVCKGRGKNEVAGKYMACGDCRGSGQKGGTTLTCYGCGGLGVIPDTRETFRQARQEIEAAQEEIARERTELTDKPKLSDLLNILSKTKDEKDDKTHFCQCCGEKVNESLKVKICLGCLNQVKELRTNREI